MKNSKSLLTATIGLGMLLAAPFAMANDPAKQDRSMAAQDTHAAHGAQHDSSQPGTDTWITTKVKGDLLVSGGTPGTEIGVETKNGVVWLSGTVATKEQHDQAVAKARMIEGVKSVNASKLQVAGAARK